MLGGEIRQPMFNLQTARLYTFVDTAYLGERTPEDVARALVDGGSDVIQLRAKGWPVAEIQRVAEKLLPLTQPAGVGLVINDHLAVARNCGAPLCHLGQEDFFGAGHAHVSELTAGQSALEGRSEPAVGLSTHSPDQARRALAAGPAYIAIGPVYATATKPTARPVKLEYVRWAAAHVALPWFAIGGVNLETLDDVLAAGARRICVVSAILNAPDIAKACQRFRDRLVSARPSEIENPRTEA